MIDDNDDNDVLEYTTGAPVGALPRLSIVNVMMIDYDYHIHAVIRNFSHI